MVDARDGQRIAGIVEGLLRRECDGTEAHPDAWRLVAELRGEAPEDAVHRVLRDRDRHVVQGVLSRNGFVPALVLG